ncbi:hypothetical protein PCANC_21358 [Puccinia coronata f. sp. avenae]|uniref:cellulase n=1 Tax=Puccinia coronata f. sp. avenae TaxID=200324 RepID=A0A2N5SA72_9BASI|nr:hypothetical protein PCANC_21358 [Puccinia coronata f. sp. avenae]
MTCKLYRVLVAACAVAVLAHQACAAAVASHPELASADGKTKPSLSPIRIPKLPAFAGVTLSGMDFGSNSTSNSSTLSSSRLQNVTADLFTIPDFEQAIHYLEDREVGLIKLPLSWESLQRNITQLEIYTDVVATVTSRNASAIVTLSISPEQFSNFTSNTTLHNGTDKDHHKKYLLKDAANASFVELWGKMAAHFQHDRRVIFHLMAIPHGSVLPRNWNQTVQAAVTNIRKNGARNVIILPSFISTNETTFNSFRDFPKDFERMQHVKNPDGTTDGIVFDVAQTLGPKGPNSQRCKGVDVSKIVSPVVKILKEHERQAIVGTLAAGSDSSCTKTLVKFAKQISGSYPSLAGFVMYGAGAFNESSPWTLIKEVQPDSAHCVAESAEELIDQPNFKSVEPFFPKKTHTGSSNTTSHP